MTCFGKQISKINPIFLGFLPVSRFKKKKKSDIGSSKLQDKIQKPESGIQGLLGCGSQHPPTPLLGQLFPKWFSVIFERQMSFRNCCRPHSECCLHFAYTILSLRLLWFSHITGRYTTSHHCRSHILFIWDTFISSGTLPMFFLQEGIKWWLSRIRLISWLSYVLGSQQFCEFRI